MADRPKIQRLMFWDEPRPTLEDLVKLSPQQWARLADFVDQYGFVSGLQEILGLAAALNITHEHALDLLKYIEVLNDQRVQFAFSPEDVLEEFRIYLERRNLTELLSALSNIEQPLLRLFRDRPEAALRDKIRAVTSGLIPVAASFESLCDLRPVFNEQRDKILQYISVAIIRVTARNETSDEISDLVFQIDVDGLRELELFLERLKKKFTAVESARQTLPGGKN